jgi:hypothetical protein
LYGGEGRGGGGGGGGRGISLTVQKLVKELNRNRETVKLILTENMNMKKSLSKNSTEKCLGQARNKKKNLLRT